MSYEDFCNKHMTQSIKLSKIDGDKLIQSANDILKRLQERSNGTV